MGEICKIFEKDCRLFATHHPITNVYIILFLQMSMRHNIPKRSPWLQLIMAKWKIGFSQLKYPSYIHIIKVKCVIQLPGAWVMWPYDGYFQFWKANFPFGHDQLESGRPFWYVVPHWHLRKKCILFQKMFWHTLF